MSQMIQDKHSEISFIFILVNMCTVTLNTHYHLQQLKNIKYFSANWTKYVPRCLVLFHHSTDETLINQRGPK